MTKALIIGGGIAGAATAIACRKAGIDAIVFEAYPEGADDVGAFLTVMANGMAALRTIDADEPVVAHSFPAASVELYDHTGRHLTHRDIARGEGPGARTLRRAVLHRVLHAEVVARGGRIAHGKRLVTATPTAGGGVVATFADGTRAEGDLLVGADGLRSTVRTVIDPGAPHPRYTGLHIVYGYTDDPPTPTAPDAYHFIFGRRAFFGYTTVPDGPAWWFVRLSGTELTDADRAAATPEYWKRRALDALAGDDTPAAGIVAAAGDEVVGGNGYDIPTTPVWYRASMVLVGDAAHAASPAAGQGASMALEDSVVLAKCLRDLPDTGQAFHAYERQRRERTEDLVEASARQGGGATPGPLRRALRNLALSGRLGRRRPDPRPVDQRLSDHRVDWDTPIPPDAGGAR
ncbi:FAD-dependent monooxygenase [Planosporangium sp. 12N6]|uniref:FAD-dependent monooxygenase n=1 Tax=Planosporangium spinosum TaxID=3402278 RepID=UPI003CF90244